MQTNLEKYHVLLHFHLPYIHSFQLNSLSLLEMYMLLRELIDTTIEEDESRLVINMKVLLSYFFAMGTIEQKYALKMLVAVAQVEVLFSPQMVYRALWGRFCNNLYKLFEEVFATM